MAVNLNQVVGIFALLAWACGNSPTDAQIVQADVTEVSHTAVGEVLPEGPTNAEITVGAERWSRVLAEVSGKRVGCVVNHTSIASGQHLVDRMLDSGVDVRRVFAPEHGFRGEASDGERVTNQVDARTGLPIVSLYGKTKKPTAEMLADIDVLVFDIQDVGTRFYTYISTLYYLVEACTATNTELLVLDRPNPNGHYIDGPMLAPGYESFIGIARMPVVHGLTVGELARYFDHLITPEHNAKLRPRVVPCDHYTVGQEYVLPIKPSPNLPTQSSIYLYPTLCFFEGTVASIGRGTDFPFEVVGHPDFPDMGFTFTPEARPGAAYAKLKGQTCNGIDLRGQGTHQADSINWPLIDYVAGAIEAAPFVDRTKHFDLVAGGPTVRAALNAGTLGRFSETYQEELSAWRGEVCPWLLYERVNQAEAWSDCTEFMLAP